MKDAKFVNELEEKILSWQADNRDDPLIKKCRENPKFSPTDIQSLIEELTLRRVEAAELQEIRKELDESRRQYQELFEFHPDGFLILNDSNFIKDTNLAISSELGQKRDKLIGLDFLSLVHPDSRENFNLFLNRLFQSRRKCSCEILLQKKADDSIPVKLTGRVRKDSEGRYEILIIISQNQNASGNRDNPLAIVDMDGKLTHVNAALCRTTGYSQSELLNQPFADFLFEDDRYRIMARLLKVRMGIPVSPKVEFRVICKNQNLLRFSARPQPIHPAGQVVGFLVILCKTLDATEPVESIESRQVCLQSQA